jgi:uncharacterized protein YvpB/LysM repeat protein
MKRTLPVLVMVVVLDLVFFSAARGASLPDSAYIPGVVGHPQTYALSCESRSAVDLAGFWGVSIGETEFLQALPSSDNPDEGFVGDPNGVWGRIPPHGYGVHADPVAAALRDFGLQAESHHGLTWDDLRSEISAGRPVIVWVIGSMWSGTPVDYKAADGSTSRVAAFEHTMLLTGYGTDSVQVIDAYSGQYNYYWLSAFLDSWSVLGNMAVFASRESTKQEEPARAADLDTYIVQPGDYLMQLAREFQLSWLELAEINSISYPYTIFSGQVLHLPVSGSNTATATPVADHPPSQSDSTSKVTTRMTLPVVMNDYGVPVQATNPVVTPEPEVIKTAIVLHTDTLIGYARSIGIAWHVLAELNNLSPMHVLRPGEIIKIK